MSVLDAYAGTPAVDDTAPRPAPAPGPDALAAELEEASVDEIAAAAVGIGAPDLSYADDDPGASAGGAGAGLREWLAEQEGTAVGPTTAAAAAAAVAGPGADPTPRRPRVLLAVSGSVASIKVALLAEALLQFCGGVRVVATASARHFFTEAQLPPQCRPLLGDEEEWREWRAVGDPVMHIELRRWADALVVAPLSANTLAKAAGGLCDNLLTCIIRAWDFAKPMLVAPAMNTFMWESPFTEQHLAALRALGVTVVPPAADKRLACGDVGTGAMASPDDVAAAVRASLAAAGFAV